MDITSNQESDSYTGPRVNDVARKFSVIVACKEAISANGHVVTRQAEKRWVCNSEGGWVEATSQGFFGYSEIPGDVKAFASREDAEKFARRWKGHPWYCQPTGEFEVIELEPVMVTRQCGWRRAP